MENPIRYLTHKERLDLAKALMDDAADFLLIADHDTLIGSWLTGIELAGFIFSWIEPDEFATTLISKVYSDVFAVEGLLGTVYAALDMHDKHLMVTIRYASPVRVTVKL